MNLKNLVNPKIKNIRFDETIKISWLKYYDLRALVPVKDIIQFNKSKSIDAVENCFLRGTNFNYTLYEKENNKPLTSIDFKGTGNRFSEDGEYIEFKPVNEFVDMERPFELKLKAAKEFRYPYLIITIDGEGEIDKKTHMQIVNAIIENFLAKNDFETEANELYSEDIKFIDKFKPFEIKKYIIDYIIIPLEKNISKKHDNFNNIVSIHERKLINKGMDIRSAEINIPKIIDFNSKIPKKDLFGPGKCKKQAEIGSICELNISNNKIVQTVLIKNTVYPASLKLAENIAKYLAIKKYFIRSIKI